MKEKRLYGLDLLKIVSMVMVVMLHYPNFAGLLENLSINNWSFYPIWFIRVLSLVCVNCFALATGYLMTDNHFKIKKLVDLYLQIFSVNIFCVVTMYLSGNFNLNLKEKLKLVLPIIKSEYWYMTAYFVLYIVSPLLIFIVNKLNTKQLGNVCLVSILLICVFPYDWLHIEHGYSATWLIVLFLISAFIRKSDMFNSKSSKYFLWYFIFSAISFAVFTAIKIGVTTFFGGAHDISVNFIEYTSLFIVLASVSLFLAFKNLYVNGEGAKKVIKFLSSLTLGVYLIHLNPAIYDWIWHKVLNPVKFIDKPYLFVDYFISVVAIYVGCSLLEYIRQLIFKVLKISKLSEKIAYIIEKIYKTIYKTSARLLKK